MTRLIYNCGIVASSMSKWTLPKNLAKKKKKKNPTQDNGPIITMDELSLAEKSRGSLIKDH